MSMRKSGPSAKDVFVFNGNKLNAMTLKDIMHWYCEGVGSMSCLNCARSPTIG